MLQSLSPPWHSLLSLPSRYGDSPVETSSETYSNSAFVSWFLRCLTLELAKARMRKRKICGSFDMPKVVLWRFFTQPSLPRTGYLRANSDGAWTHRRKMKARAWQRSVHIAASRTGGVQGFSFQVQHPPYTTTLTWKDSRSWLLRISRGFQLRSILATSVKKGRSMGCEVNKVSLIIARATDVMSRRLSYSTLRGWKTDESLCDLPFTWSVGSLSAFDFNRCHHSLNYVCYTFRLATSVRQ